MRTIFKTIFILSLLFVIPVSKVWGIESNVKEVILKVEGMTCASCPAMIKTALKKLDGVVNVDVSYKETKATVRYQDGKVTVEQMIKAINDIGMKARLPEKGSNQERR